MCGISVLINNQDNLSIYDSLCKMNNKIIHRGPDGEGYFIDGNVGFAHRRLAIIDLSPAGNQPMTYNKYTITFNGEIFNYLELKSELEELNYTFNTNSDTEVILASYMHWGTNAFKKFNGMWAIAIFEHETRNIIMCRDNYGIKPIFYGFLNKMFFAGSEIKQFFDLDIKKIINLDSVVNYISNGNLNYSENTFFEGIKELRSGHYIEINTIDLDYEITQWYPQKNNLKSSDSFLEAKIKIEDLFDKSNKIRMRSDVIVGSCLSGGIDSTAIISSLVKQNLFSENKLNTFSAYYNYVGADERVFINEVVKEFSLINQKILPDLSTVLKNKIIDKIIYHHEQPFSSMSNFSQYAVFETTKKNEIKVLLDGQGADEYLMGYNIFRATYIKELIKAFRWKQLYLYLKNYSKTNKLRLYIVIRITILNPIINPILNIFNSNSKIFNNKLSSRFKIKSRFNSKNIKTLIFDQLYVSNLPALLHSADRNSMIFSIEGRYPFLDFELIEYVNSLPSDYFFEGGFSKSILRSSIPNMPNKIKFRTDKMGFEAPTEIFVRNNYDFFRIEIEEVLSKFDFINKNILNDFESFKNRKKSYNELYFRLFALNRFLNVFNININEEN